MMMREDWIEVELGDACEINLGQSPPSSTYNTEKEGLPFFQGKAEFTDLYPVVEKWCNNPKKIAEVDDILLSVRAPVGATNIANQKCAIGRGLAAIRYEPCYKYVLYYLKLIERILDDQGTGTTFKAISGSVLRSQKFPLAPLPEQRAIASKIEQLFSELDNGIANLKAAKSKLEIYRQAILKQAFEESVNSISFYLSEITNKIQIGPFGSQLHKEDYIEGGIPLINPMHIQDGQIYPSSSYSITIQKRDSLPNYILMKDDVIMGRRGEMGRCGLITKKEEGWFCGTGSLYLRPIKQKVYPVFLYYYLRSPIIKELLTGKATGTTMMNLNKTIISELPINLPCVEEQKQIVQEIETRLSVCDKLNESIDQSLEKAQALRQSILKKAFEGKLLSQDELQNCRQQPDWEPAAKLLERVKNKKSK
jgi:type I restriction enzyme S subunit